MSLAARAALLVAIDVQKFTIGYAPNRDNLIHPGFASSISLTAITRLRIPYAYHAHSRLRACGENRVPEQAHGQKRAETHIKGQTETWPPVRYSRIVDERMMREVKHSVSDC